MILRKCKTCGIEATNETELNKFISNKGMKYGKKNLCKVCNVSYTKNWAEKNPDKYKRGQQTTDYRRRYGVSYEEYTSCMGTSDMCEICGTTDNLCYDHNHNFTGIEAFRGVLCKKCNAGIGLLNDNEDVLLNAYLYVKGYNDRRR